jgi:hypothetical protein
MARTVREAFLATRSARLRLAVVHKPYWRVIEQGLHLGYRQRAIGGSWITRRRNDQGNYHERKLGLADDLQDADGKPILDAVPACTSDAPASTTASKAARGSSLGWVYCDGARTVEGLICIGRPKQKTISNVGSVLVDECFCYRRQFLGRAIVIVEHNRVRGHWRRVHASEMITSNQQSGLAKGILALKMHR